MPSQAEHEMLRRLVSAGALLGVRVLDYIIVGSGAAYWSAQIAGCMPLTSGSDKTAGRIARAAGDSFAIAAFVPGLV
jgi:hypothetical protein